MRKLSVDEWTSLAMALWVFMVPPLVWVGGYKIGNRDGYIKGLDDGVDMVAVIQARDIAAARAQAVEEERAAASARMLPVLPWEVK